jgi:hypothetical protein
LSEVVKIYGFGSYFFDKPQYNDIDILIVHRNSGFESCQFAIQCKQFFVLNVDGVDVTILSQQEERQMSFIEKSRSKYLGKVNEGCFESDLDEMLNRIRAVRTCKVDV